MDYKYFAAKPAEEAAADYLAKANMWFMNLDANGYLEKLRTSYAAYHGAHYSEADNSHQIHFMGENGELTGIALNHYRNLARHILVMITSTRPAMQARSVNTDYQSLVQAKLANGLLDYYMREKRLEKYLVDAVEHAVVLGSGWVKIEWNATSGDVYDFNEELNVDVTEGDIEFSVLSPFDVVFDSNDNSDQHDWLMVRSFQNRHNLVAKYPDLKDRIMSLPTKDSYEGIYTTGFLSDDTELVPVYESYHRRTEAVPEGRYMLFLAEDIVLLDSPLPYREIPVYQISPGHFMGTGYGYTDMFDLLPLQDGLNSLHSAILTNNTNFAVQNLLVPRGSDVTLESLSGGMNVIEANLQFGKPEPINFLATAKETYEYAAILEKQMETLSGVNQVSRGNPDPNLRSGNAMALIQSMSLQFMSGLQQSYVSLVEDVGTAIINILKDFAKVPRVAAIAGKSNRTFIKEFTGDDLSSINRVIVDIGNPLARTTAGRVEMAEQLMQMGAIKSPEQYLAIINHGQLDVMTEDTQSELLNIKRENEYFVENKEVIAIITDDHALHIREHKVLLSDPELRFNPEFTQMVLAHIQEHINLLKTGDPDLLALTGSQPLAPPQPPPMQAPPQQGNQQPPNAEVLGGQPTQQAQMGVELPTNLPNLPKVDPGLLPNAELQAQSLGNLRQQ